MPNDERVTGRLQEAFDEIERLQSLVDYASAIVGLWQVTSEAMGARSASPYAVALLNRLGKEIPAPTQERIDRETMDLATVEASLTKGRH